MAHRDLALGHYTCALKLGHTDNPADGSVYLIVEYGCKRYEMTFCGYMRFQGHRIWFLFRRFARAVKRNCKRLALWIGPFLLFTVLSTFVLSLFAKTGVVTFGEAVFEYSSITLSSVALLYIKDTFDFERSRHNALKLQASICEDLKYEFSASVSHLLDALGYDAQCLWDFFCKYDHPNMPPLRRREESTIDFAAATAALGRLELSLSDFQRQALVGSYIDFHIGARFGDSSRVIDTLREVREASVHPEKLDSEALSSLIWQLVQILHSIRRPWHYRNDVARNKMVDALLESQAQEIAF